LKKIPLSAQPREVNEGLAVIEGNPYIIPSLMKGTHLIGKEHSRYRARAKAQLTDVQKQSITNVPAEVQKGKILDEISALELIADVRRQALDSMK
jgi:hypothetical protein